MWYPDGRIVADVRPIVLLTTCRATGAGRCEKDFSSGIASVLVPLTTPPTMALPTGTALSLR